MLTRFRDEVPLTEPTGAVQAAVMAAITGASAGDPRGAGRRYLRFADGRGGPGRAVTDAAPGQAAVTAAARGPAASRRRTLLACSVAAAVAVAGGAVALHAAGAPPPARPAGGPGRSAVLPAGFASVGRARTGTQLVAFATRAAALSPGRAPGPHEWVYVKTETADSSAGSGGFLFGPPNERHIGVQWVRVDGEESAAPASPGRGSAARPAPGTTAAGHLNLVPGGAWSLGGWKSVSYAYLNSLPTDPARLKAVILADNLPRLPWYVPEKNEAVFTAIATLLFGECEGVWLPPKLAAAMYRLLQDLPGIHFDSATDLAGRTGLGFYLVVDGWYKHELVINPVTYRYMGDKTVAVRAHADVATDGTREIRKGQVLGWEALLAAAIVRRPGQLP
jgi:hypothetical protein